MRDVAKDQADLIAISDADRTDIIYTTDDNMEKAHVAYVSGNMFRPSSLEPCSAACQPCRLCGGID